MSMQLLSIWVIILVVYDKLLRFVEQVPHFECF